MSRFVSATLRTSAVAVSSVQRVGWAMRALATVASNKPRAQRVGFIGLGNMGVHMATNLLKAGHPLTVFDVSQKGIDAIKAHGEELDANVRVARTPADVALDCHVIVTMLPSSPHVMDVYTNERSGVLAAFPKSTSVDASTNSPLLIDSSTIDPGTAREVVRLAHEHSCAMVDAPVSGGVGGAEAATLTFMVGGSEAHFNAARPYLSRMGRNIVHCGDAGTGQIAKVCNNLVLGITMAAVSEAMAIGVKLGAEPAKLASIFNTSSARCWSSDTYNPVPGVLPNVPASRDYEGGFGASLMMKDLGLAVMAAQQAGMKAELGEFSLSLYRQLELHGWQHKDFSVLYKLFAEKGTKQ